MSDATFHIRDDAGTALAVTWFCRSDPFACLNPSPACDTEFKLEPGDTLRLRHRFVFIDQVTDHAALEPIAAEFAL